MQAAARITATKPLARKQRQRAKLAIVKNAPPAPVDIERIALAALFEHLGARGFAPVCTFDGVGVIAFSTIADSIESIMSAEQSTLMVQAENGNPHAIFIVPGNGADLIGAWSFDDGDSDGFNRALVEFDRVANS